MNNNDTLINKTTGLLTNLKKMAGINIPSFTRNNISLNKINTNSLTDFTDLQLAELAQRNHVSRSNRNNTNSNILDVNNLITYLNPTYQNSSEKAQNAERLKALAPEISRAETVIISALMAPNDYQEARPYFTIPDMDYLSTDIKVAITDFLKNYFIENLHIEKKMTNWAQEALFRSGAGATILLPEGTLTKLVKNLSSPLKGQESLTNQKALNNFFSEKNYTTLLKQNIYDNDSYHYGTENNYKSGISLSSTENKKSYKLDMTTIRSGLESYFYSEYEGYSKQYLKNLSAGIEDITARLVTKLEDGDVISITDNPEVLRFGRAVRSINQNRLNKTLDELYKRDEEENQAKYRDKINQLHQTREQPIIDLTPYLTDITEQKSHPFCIDISSESIIPINVPGSNNEKLGYFVLIGDLGHPLDAKNYISGNGGCSTSSRLSAAYTAMFGSKGSDGNGGSSPFMPNSGMFQNAASFQENAMSKVFNYILDEMLKQKLKNVGLNDVKFGKYETIATCMFYRLLEQKRTSLLFVPQSLMTYVAFDYREDGCGKSLLDNIEFILSLKLTALIANIMSMMRNAIAKKDIEVTFDQKQTNYAGVLEQIKNAVISKYKFNLSSDPNSIAQSILNQNLSIRAFGQPNAPGFDIKTSDSQPTEIKADTELLDVFDKWITLGFGVPPSAMGELGNIEFARSLISQDLFFNKENTKRQDTLCTITSEQFIRPYIKYDPILIAGLKKILKGYILTSKQDIEKDQEIQTSTDDSPNMNPNQTSDEDILLYNIINKVEIKLPSSNMTTSKTQYELFKDYNEIISDIVDKLYPDELITNQDHSDTYKLLKASIKSTMVKEFISMMLPNINIDSFDEFVIRNRSDIYKLINITSDFNSGLKKNQTARSGTSTSDTGGGFGEESGTDGFGFNEDTEGGEEPDFNFDTESPTETTTTEESSTESEISNTTTNDKPIPELDIKLNPIEEENT